MTAQVTLLNGLGVALASDSAVTFGGKVLNSSEKIFDLALPHKLAVMTSGRADFMGIPWEVILSAWSETLNRPFPKITEYRDSLMKFVRTILPDNAGLNDVEIDHLDSCLIGPGGVLEAARQAMNDFLVPHFQAILEAEDLHVFMGSEDWTPEFRERMTALLTEEVVSEVHTGLLNSVNQRVSRFPVPIDGVKETQARVWIDKYWANLSMTPYDYLESWPSVPGLDVVINEVWAKFILHFDYGSFTAVHFLGFGSMDLFPSGAGIYLSGVVDGVLLKKWEGEAESSGSPRYFFFGQSDAIRTITSGEDYLLIDAAVENTRKTLSDIWDRISDIKAEGLESTREFIKQSMEGETMADDMRRVGDESRRKPFYRAIEMAPILDLAEFAAQLVGVQAASAAMTQDNPTVGGPVDVAVITHRGGFQWIRHTK